MKKIVALIFSISLISSPVRADWVNSWIDQKTVASPNHFSTQQKGYGTFGSFSARWHNPREPIATFTPPRFGSLGCGGIDMFFGGYSFLKKEYIVEKLKKMMGPAAAAFAYGIAMSSINSQANAVLQDLQKISDFLNGLQLNECAVSQRAFEIGSAMGKEHFQGKTEAASAATIKYISDSGIGQGWRQISEKAQGYGGKISETITKFGSSGQAANEGCPAIIKEVFQTVDLLSKNMSVEGKNQSMFLGTERYPVELVKIISSFAGDIAITQENNGNFEYRPVRPCAKNPLNDLLINIETGEYHLRRNDDYNKCEKASKLKINGKEFNNIKDWVDKSFDTVFDNIQKKQAITDDSAKSLINTIPLPVLKNVAEAAYKNDKEIMNTIKDYSSKMITYNIIFNFFSATSEVLSRLEAIKAQNSNAEKDKESCVFDINNDVAAKLKTINDNAKEILVSAKDEYTKYIKEIDTGININEFLSKENSFDRKTQRFLSSMSMDSSKK